VHSGPMADSEGEFSDWKPTKAENPAFKCRECSSDDVHYRAWDSSDGAYEDYQYHCHGCGRRWWVEGDDG
jgi:DNA-directed RNA polymerase subunit M/transcription elongation factor TFIIS